MTSKERKADYYQKNKEHLREKQRKWREENREVHRAYGRQWAKENRARMNATHKAYNKRLRKEAIELYGGKCACCGERVIEFLAFDHINGNGKKHRGRCGSSGFYKRLLDYKNSFIRILCHNCNLSLGFYGYCPHDNSKRIRPN